MATQLTNVGKKSFNHSFALKLCATIYICYSISLTMRCGLRQIRYKFSGCIMKSLFVRVGIGMFAALCAIQVWAVDVFEFDSEGQRQRYQQLAYELRCPKCQNQNLADSNSQISQDLRAEVVKLLKEGKTDAEIRQYMVDRYGDFVLYNPPVQSNTIVLWWGPLIILLLAAIAFVSIVLKRSKVTGSVEGEPEIDEGLLDTQSLNAGENGVGELEGESEKQGGK